MCCMQHSLAKRMHKVTRRNSSRVESSQLCHALSWFACASCLAQLKSACVLGLAKGGEVRGALQVDSSMLQLVKRFRRSNLKALNKCGSILEKYKRNATAEVENVLTYEWPALPLSSPPFPYVCTCVCVNSLY